MPALQVVVQADDDVVAACGVRGRRADTGVPAHRCRAAATNTQGTSPDAWPPLSTTPNLSERGSGAPPGPAGAAAVRCTIFSGELPFSDPLRLGNRPQMTSWLSTHSRVSPSTTS